MNAETEKLFEAELTRQVIAAFYDVYNTLGRGFLESVYENAMVIALHERSLQVVQQASIDVHFRQHLVGQFRADLLVENRLILECKTTAGLTPAHEAQLLNYLRATRIPLGLLLNFGPEPQFKRRILTSSPIRVDPRQSVAGP